MKPRILIAGGSGLLGSVLTPFLRSKEYEVLAHGHSAAADIHFDAVINDEIGTHLDRIQPDVIINLIALTNVDLCETDPDLAFRLNVKTVENLATWAGHNKKFLIQLSTDQLYEGEGIKKESEITIKNMYAMSKYAGELAALGLAETTILRTNFFGKSRLPSRRSFSDWIVEQTKMGAKLNLFSDVHFSPLSMSSLCEAILCALCKRQIGTFNLGSKGGMSKADFAFKMAEALGLDTERYTRIRIEESAATRSVRPKNMLMDSSLFEKQFSYSLPNLEDEISREAKRYV